MSEFGPHNEADQGAWSIPAGSTPEYGGVPEGQMPMAEAQGPMAAAQGPAEQPPSQEAPPAAPGAYSPPGSYPPPPAGAYTTPPGGYYSPPPPPPGMYPGYSGYPQPAPASASGSHWGRPVRLAVAAATTVAAMAVGVVAGHAVWGAGTSRSASSQNGSSSNPGGTYFDPFGSNGGSGSSPFSGSGNSGSGNSGSESPFGNFSPFGGSSGSGSSGSGSSGSGSTGSGSPSDVSSIAAKADPALVDINVQFGYQQSGGAGTGIVLTSNGEVLTNNHVVDGATKISVTDVGNGKTYNGSVVGYDPTHDIAVVQLQDASGLKTATIANSSDVTVGEGVVALGNAGGVGGTPNSAGGSVVNLNQAITASDDLDGTAENLTGLIETNANVQAGDSGGALVNSSGEVIGMDTAAAQGFSLSASGTNQGYAIPINQAIQTAQQIESGHGSSDVHVGATAFLGLLLGSNQNSLGNNNSGLSVSGSVAGSPAAKAGLTEGDTITSINGQTVNTYTALRNALISDHPGDSVQIGWTDSNGQSHTSTVVLASGPAS